MALKPARQTGTLSPEYCPAPVEGFVITRFLVISDLFFFNDPAPPEFYPLPLHDALPISVASARGNDGDCASRRCSVPRRWLRRRAPGPRPRGTSRPRARPQPPWGALFERPVPSRSDARRDRKSTRLNSSHGYISYAVFCL